MKLNSILRAAFFLVALGLSPTSLYADDTEIYYARADVDNDQNEQIANVLFLIDTSGSMCDPPNGGSRDCSKTSTKMFQLKQAFRQVIDGVDNGVRVGVGKFNGGADNSGFGGYVFYPVSEMTEAARTEVKNLVDGLQGTSNTPTMEAYSEMARYMMGRSPSDYAKAGEALQNDPRRAVNIGYGCIEYRRNGSCRREGFFTTAEYDSPMNMQNQCESNHIIVMTDGDPTYDGDESAAENLTGGNCNVPGGSSSGSSYECQKEIADWLYKESRNNKRSVKTWQVAFGQNISKLNEMQEVAEIGGTESVRLADNASELAREFNDILELIAEESQSITSPGVSVNQNNRLEHLDQLYFALFKPEKTSVWPGNLKRYGASGGNVTDRTGQNAINSETGGFREDASSFWSSTEDGADVRKGGALEQLEGRRLYIGNNSDDGGEYRLQPNTTTFNNLTNARFGIPNSNAVVDFDSKLKVYNALSTMWADPMHSVPLLVNYELGSDANDAEGQQNYVFVSTNGGMLHAIDTSDGSEKFAFMPDEMLRKAYDFVRSPPLKSGNIRSLYGMDSSWVPIRIAGADGDAEKVWIFGGMRRGGYNYYGLDVSSIDTPKLEWRIRGNSGSGGTTSGFDKLGQTWSTPTVTSVRIDGEVRTVLVFGGGYDPDGHDTEGERANEDDVGNAVYMVDAYTGDLIWSASNEGNSQGASSVHDAMNWAIPGGISVVDLPTDGIADYLYFGDLGGQVFRVNLDNSNEGAEGLVDGVVRLANLGEDSHRRFYEAPAVGYQRSGLSETLYVAIGSGYRAHPLDEETDEAFFMLIDRNFKSSEQNDVISRNDLTPVGASTSADPEGDGWRFDFTRDGEKVMSSPTIFQGDVFFTTYVPTDIDQEEDPCQILYGQAFAYRASMLTGAARSFTNDGSANWSGEELDNSGIPPSVVPIYLPPPGPDDPDNDPNDPDNDPPEPGTVRFNVGREFVGEDGIDYNNFRKRRWYQLEKNEANQFFPPGQESE